MLSYLYVGTYSEEQATVCSPCPAGYVCTDPTQAPVPCEPGMYSFVGEVRNIFVLFLFCYVFYAGSKNALTAYMFTPVMESRPQNQRPRPRPDPPRPRPRPRPGPPRSRPPLPRPRP